MSDNVAEAAAREDIGNKLLDAAREAIGNLLDSNPDLRPQCLRIAFYDALKYDATTKTNGPNGSIRTFEDDKPIKDTIIELDNIKNKLDPKLQKYLSYADLYQLAGVVAVNKAGGPIIEFQLGRMDSCMPIDSTQIRTIIKDFETLKDSSEHNVRNTFNRLGFTDKEIVALSAAYSYWLNYTDKNKPMINYSYYKNLCDKEKREKDSSSTITDKKPSRSGSTADSTVAGPQYWKWLLEDASFRQHVEKFKEDPKEFETVYSIAHKKLSELGFRQFPQPIPIASQYHDMKHGIVFALAMTILFGFVGFFYEVMRI